MTSVNDKKFQDTLLHLDYYVEKGEMETIITQLDDVIYASSSPDLYFKDVTDNTLSYLSASGGFEFYEDNLLQKRLTREQREQIRVAPKRNRGAIRDFYKNRDKEDRNWAKEGATWANNKYGLKGRNRRSWRKSYNSIKFKREYEDKKFNERVGAHEENKGIKKSIAEFTKKLFEGKQNSTSAATGVLAALLNNGEKVNWSTDNINDWIDKQSIEIERGGKKLKIKYDKQNDGFDVFDLDKLKKLNSKPISSFSDAWGVANKSMGGSGGGTTVSFGDTGSKSGTKASNTEAVSGGMNSFFNWFTTFGAEFRRGYAEAYDRSLERHGFPSGKVYRDSPQHFWEIRAQLATEYAIGTDHYERAVERINKMTDENSTAEQRNAAKKSAWNDWLKVRSKVEEEASGIGSNLNDVITHVNKIKDPTDKDALPPVSGWPSRYGGRNRVVGLQKNLARAKLSAYSNDTFGGNPNKEPEPLREEETKRTEEESKRAQTKQNNDEWEEWENRKIPQIERNERQEEDNKFEGMSSNEIFSQWAQAQEILGISPDDEDFQEQWKNSSAYAYYRQAQLKENADKYDRWNDMSSGEIFSEWAKENGIDENAQLSFEDNEKWINSQEHKWFSDIEKKEIEEAAEQKASEKRREIEEAFINFHETGEFPIPSEDGQGEQQVQQDQDPNMANASGEGGEGGGGSGDQVPPEYREYLEGNETPPEGIPLLTGSKRGQEGSSSKFYDKRVAAAKKQQQIEGGGGIAVPGQAGWDEGKKQAGFTSGSEQGPRGQLNLADDNEMTGDNKMAKPVDDYKEIIEQAVDKAKQQQSKSKVRSAKAQARVAKAHANEAEANAEAAEQKAEEKIASILHKLDSNISELNARKNPEINSVLSKLDSTISFAKSDKKN